MWFFPQDSPPARAVPPPLFDDDEDDDLDWFKWNISQFWPSISASLEKATYHFILSCSPSCSYCNIPPFLPCSVGNEKINQHEENWENWTLTFSISTHFDRQKYGSRRKNLKSSRCMNAGQTELSDQRYYIARNFRVAQELPELPRRVSAKQSKWKWPVFLMEVKPPLHVSSFSK